MFLINIIEDELYFNDKKAKEDMKKQEKAKCACGRTVCCGKHKKGCHFFSKRKERE